MLFDVDGTLYDGNIHLSIIDPLHEAGLLSDASHRDFVLLRVEYENHKVSQDDAVVRANTLLCEGLVGQEYKKVAEFYSEYARGVTFHSNVFECFEAASVKGIHCYLVSGGSELGVEPIAKLLGVKKFVATSTPHSSRFEGELPEVFYTSEQKKRFLMSIAPKYDAICGFGDSRGDLGIMQDAAVIVNPRDSFSPEHGRFCVVRGDDFSVAFSAGLGLLESKLI